MKKEDILRNYLVWFVQDVLMKNGDDKQTAIEKTILDEKIVKLIDNFTIIVSDIFLKK